MDVFSDTEPVDSRLETAGAIAMTFLLTYWGYQLLSSPQPYILLDYVNFVTHETGGVLFLFANQFWFMVGQNVYQNVVPLAFLVYFYKKNAPIGAAFSAFWLGDNLLQTGIYMKDAQAMVLPILSIWGGGDADNDGHDWNYIFSQTHAIRYAPEIGGFFWFIGMVWIVGSVAYLFYLSVQRFYPALTLQALLK